MKERVALICGLYLNDGLSFDCERTEALMKDAAAAGNADAAAYPPMPAVVTPRDFGERNPSAVPSFAAYDILI